jgi:crossover junction endodeoxyribonuclease RuvC
MGGCSAMRSARSEQGRVERVLGVDPSFNRSGWAILTRDGCGLSSPAACGVIIPRGSSRSERLLSIQRQFEQAVTRWRPAVAYFERPGSWQRKGGSRPETVEAMGMARGVMLTACAAQGVPAFEVDFRTVRRALLGHGNAGADHVVEFVTSRGLDPPRRPRGGVDLDAANAIMMAVYGLGCEVSIDGGGGTPPHGKGPRSVSAQLPLFEGFPDLQDSRLEAPQVSVLRKATGIKGQLPELVGSVDPQGAQGG